VEGKNGKKKACEILRGRIVDMEGLSKEKRSPRFTEKPVER